MKNYKKLFWIFIIVLLILLTGYFLYLHNKNFSFKQTSSLEKNKVTSIEIFSPLPNQTVSSPLSVRGRAKGEWFFEGSFPAQIVSLHGKILGKGSMVAQGDWQTSDFVNFSGTLTFSKSEFSQGKLILQKDNPSGLQENSEEYVIPIKFIQ